MAGCLFLAVIGLGLGVATPGVFVVFLLQQRLGMFQSLGEVGWAFVLQVAVDFVFWLSVVGGGYWLVSRWRQHNAG